MRQVSYAGQTFVTTDEMAGALVNFTAAIAGNNDSEPLSIPAVDDHHEPISIDLVVGPTSEVLSIPFAGDDDLDTRAEVKMLQEWTERLVASRSQRPAGLPLDEPMPTLSDTDI